MILMPSVLFGTVAAPPSKSCAHRMLLCAALAKEPSELSTGCESEDIAATRRCLTALGAEMTASGGSWRVTPLKEAKFAELDVGESGSTLRFLLPVVCALGCGAEFLLHGRLPQRPLSPLKEELEAHGCRIVLSGNRLSVSGRLTGNCFALPGDVSSQFISGLLFALPLCGGGSICVTGKRESEPYLHLTLAALEQAGVSVRDDGTVITVSSGYGAFPGGQTEGDWSGAAALLCAGALRGSVTVSGLSMQSVQGDRRVVDVLESFGARVLRRETGVTVFSAPLHGTEVDCAMIPDLVPVLATVAAGATGSTRFFHAGRLRLKESDRIDTTCRLINALGGRAEQTAEELLVTGTGMLEGGAADACGDHRIAMAAGAAALLCGTQVVLNGAETVGKSYPAFWADYQKLGGRIL